MVAARGLRKSYGDFEAVKGIDVEVRKGEAFGFLGPNGAGKSSTMRMIGAVSPVTEGTLEILGMDPAVDGSRIRDRIGVCPQEDTLDNELNVAENMLVYGRYFGLSRAEANRRGAELLDFHGRLAGLGGAELAGRIPELLERVGLAGRGGERVRRYSKGMTQRLGLALALLARPDLVLLDEPTSALDPVGRREVRELVRELAAGGVTVRATARGGSQFLRVPPPVVREVASVLEPP